MPMEITDVVVIPVIIAIVEVLKKVGMPVKLAPIVDIILGLIAGFVYIAPQDPKLAVFYGLVMGLTATGLYSATKNTYQGLSPPKTTAE